MTARPILFSGNMVRALLEGRKTQTRRVLKPQPENRDSAWFWQSPGYDNGGGADYFHTRCVEGIMGAWRRSMPNQPGDCLWVREAWRAELTWESLPPKEIPTEAAIFYSADGTQKDNGLGAKFRGKQRSSIHMPRWASRLTLTVTDVRVQRLQDISGADCIDEGVKPVIGPNAKSGREVFRHLWDSLNADRGFGWDANPWVAAYTFTVEHQNIDQVAA